ncbi:MAG: 50S ribosomal protein L11 methyltransferase [Myxococcaceae bacterium]
MASFSLSVDVPESEAELAASTLWDAGCTGLEVRDAEAPPMPGVRGPTEGEAILIACFSTAEEAEAARALLSEGFPTARLSLEAVPEVDWSLAWRAHIRPTRVGRLWVGPPWETAPPDAVALHIEPKMAFGTGDHPTTRLCLEAVDEFLLAHPLATVLDVGTGTGVLALAARKLGASHVVAVDTDSVSVGLAEENARANAVEGVDFSAARLQALHGPFDLVLANILANTLVELSGPLAAHTGHTLVLAGVLRPQVEEVARAFVAHGLRPGPVAYSGDWARLSFTRGAA